jgi:hypothetical protein
MLTVAGQRFGHVLVTDARTYSGLHAVVMTVDGPRRRDRAVAWRLGKSRAW